MITKFTLSHFYPYLATEMQLTWELELQILPVVILRKMEDSN